MNQGMNINYTNRKDAATAADNVLPVVVTIVCNGMDAPTR